MKICTYVLFLFLHLAPSLKAAALTPSEEAGSTPTTNEDWLESMSSDIRTGLGKVLNDPSLVDTIVTSFKNYVDEEEYGANGTKEDIEEGTDSMILDHVIERVDAQLDLDKKEEQIELIKDEIYWALPAHKKCREELTLTMERIKLKISKYFAGKYGQCVAQNMLKGLEKVLKPKNIKELSRVDSFLNEIKEKVQSILNDRKFQAAVKQEQEEEKGKEEVGLSLAQMDGEIAYIVLNEMGQFILNPDKIELCKLKWSLPNPRIAVITEQFLERHAKLVYKHTFGIGQTFHKSRKKKKMLPSESLLVAKTLDITNKYPIFYWLQNLYLKEYMQKYKNGEIPVYKYSVSDWTRENTFFQWITHNHPELGKHIEDGLKEAITGHGSSLFRPMTFNSDGSPLICDRLSDFADYACSVQDLMRTIHEGLNSPNAEFGAPLQIDVWIIPQMTCRFYPQYTYYKLSQEGGVEDDKPRQDDIWDLEELLQHPRLGYIKGKDFFVCHVNNASKDGREKISSLMKKHVAGVRKRPLRNNRYIFIIDRRNPENLKNKNLAHKPAGDFSKKWPDKVYLIAPKKYRNNEEKPLCVCGEVLGLVEKKDMFSKEICANCAEKGGKLYFCQNKEHQKRTGMSDYFLCSEACEKARPDTHSCLSPRLDMLPEFCLGLSSAYLFTNPLNPAPTPIQYRNAMNGYMFGLSYHLLSQNNVPCYWYYNAGGVLFTLDDISWAWPRWFEKINGKLQELNQNCFRNIKEAGRLPNARFEEFERQAKELSRGTKI